jgi:hypothetical protein
LTGIIGGLVAALGCLFSSFASQFHQLFISYGLLTGHDDFPFSTNVYRLPLRTIENSALD